jgi:hypothetical protein
MIELLNSSMVLEFSFSLGFDCRINRDANLAHPPQADSFVRRSLIDLSVFVLQTEEGCRDGGRRARQRKAGQMEGAGKLARAGRCRKRLAFCARYQARDFDI